MGVHHGKDEDEGKDAGRLATAVRLGKLQNWEYKKIQK